MQKHANNHIYIYLLIGATLVWSNHPVIQGIELSKWWNTCTSIEAARSRYSDVTPIACVEHTAADASCSFPTGFPSPTDWEPSRAAECSDGPQLPWAWHPCAGDSQNMSLARFSAPVACPSATVCWTGMLRRVTGLVVRHRKTSQHNRVCSSTVQLLQGAWLQWRTCMRRIFGRGMTFALAAARDTASAQLCIGTLGQRPHHQQTVPLVQLGSQQVQPWLHWPLPLAGLHWHA